MPEQQFEIDLEKVNQKLLERNAALTNECVRLQVLVEQLIDQQQAMREQQAATPA